MYAIEVDITVIPDGVDWIASLRLGDGTTLEMHGPGEEGAVHALKQLILQMLRAGTLHPMQLVKNRN